MKTKTLLFTLLLLPLAGKADLLIYEPFQYTPGTSFILSQGGFGWAPGGWQRTGSGGSTTVIGLSIAGDLTSPVFPFPPPAPANPWAASPILAHAGMDHVNFHPIRTFNASTASAMNMDQNGAIYFSFLTAVQELTVNRVLFGGSSRAVTVGFEPDGEGGLTAQARFGANADEPEMISTGGSFLLNTTYFVVGRITQTATGDDSLSMLVLGPNDILPTSPPEIWTASVSGPVTGTLSQFSMVHLGDFSPNNNNGLRFLMDEVRIGTTWEAVATPEPGTFALVGMAMVILGRMYRRRRIA